MSEQKIEKYFSPVSRPSKRPKSSTSPEANINEAMEKVGDMTHGQLMASISASLSTLLDSKLSNLATKEDLVTLTVQVADLVEENKSLKEEVNRLRVAERATAAKLVDLESRSRRNNLIFRGIKCAQTKDYRALISKFCAEKFGTGNTLWINRAHPLGRDGSSVIAHFPADSDIEYIMTRVSQLKGTGFSVHRDYPNEVRHKRMYLSAVRREVEKVAGRRRMPMMFDHLTIDGQRYTWEDGKLMAGQQDGLEALQRKFNHDFSEALASLKKSGQGGARDADSRGGPPLQTATLVENHERETTAGTASTTEEKQ